MARPKGFPELASWLPAAQAAVTGYLEPFVRCIATDGPGETIEAFGSGVLAGYGERPLLVTAKHVLDRLGSRPLHLEVDGAFQPIVGKLRSADSEAADVAVLELPREAFDWGTPLVDLRVQGERGQDAELHTYIAMGFPTRESQLLHESQQLSLKLINYWTIEAPALYTRLGIDKAISIVVKYEREHSYRAGTKMALKKPHGMSGGVLWRFWGPKDEMPTLKRGCFAGVLTEYRRNSNCMVAARTRVVQDLASRLA